jgi:SAM-dependent methyltransferase
MTDIELYRETGLEIYEKVHYSRGEHIREVDAILSWYKRDRSRILDMGCSGGFHAIEFAKRGHFVTGIDAEPSAIDLARKRSQAMQVEAVFLVVDLESEALTSLGRFDLIYSLGNVLSHIRKEVVPEVLGNIRTCLDEDGIFLFDVLHVGVDFPEEVREEDLGIVWKRNLDRKTGMIRLTGIYSYSGFIQDFQVWGYTREQVVKMLTQAGFRDIEASGTLDFSGRSPETENAVCLRYRAKASERP